MNKKIIFLLTLSTLMLLVSCKPKQSNYKSIYETAKEKEGRNEIIEEVSYTIEDEEENNNAENMNTAVRKETIKPVLDNEESKIKKYSVVIAAMGMKPNAESLQERMQAAGYETVIVQNNQGMYRVIIAGSGTKEGAISERASILSQFKRQGDNEQLRKKYGIPFNDWWILERQY